MEDLQGNERYRVTNASKGIIHKIDMKNKPDKQGLEFHIISETDNGYLVYVAQEDPSQPATNLYIDKKYFVDRPQAKEKS